MRQTTRPTAAQLPVALAWIRSTIATITTATMAMATVMIAMALTAFTALPRSALADPPDRVARLAYLRGEVGLQPAGSDQWSAARLNRPLVTGDKLYLGREARIEMDIGAAQLRLDEGSSLEWLDLDDRNAQIELSQGTLKLHVRQVDEGQTYEVDTPMLALVVSEPGEYRIDVAPQDGSTTVSVIDGAAVAYGADDASTDLRAGQAWLFTDASLRNYARLNRPPADDFDRWCSQRDALYERPASPRHVSTQLIGYEDLDRYGSWSPVPEYGEVWFPAALASDWAPYRYGHWAWIEPWGWTWIDDAPWGFAPFHYGRWCYVHDRWGWIPGPIVPRPIYAPALVAFVGGGDWSLGLATGLIGWFPLGPGDLFRPWYPGSRRYFTLINTTNIRSRALIDQRRIDMAYDDYAANRVGHTAYAYRNAAAVTAVAGRTFADAQPVAHARVAIDRARLERAEPIGHVPVMPVAASLAGAARMAAPPGTAFARRVIARRAPPPEPLPFVRRQTLIRENGGMAVPAERLREMAAQTTPGSTTGRQHIEVIGAGGNRAQRAAPQATPEGDRRTPPEVTPGHGRAPSGEAGAGQAAPRSSEAGRAAPQPAGTGPHAAPPAVPSAGFVPHGTERETAPGSAQHGAPAPRPVPQPAPTVRVAPAQEGPHPEATPHEPPIRETPRYVAPPREAPAREAPRFTPPERELKPAPEREFRPPPQQFHEAPTREAPVHEAPARETPRFTPPQPPQQHGRPPEPKPERNDEHR